MVMLSVFSNSGAKLCHSGQIFLASFEVENNSINNSALVGASVYLLACTDIS